MRDALVRIPVTVVVEPGPDLVDPLDRALGEIRKGWVQNFFLL